MPVNFCKTLQPCDRNPHIALLWSVQGLPSFANLNVTFSMEHKRCKVKSSGHFSFLLNCMSQNAVLSRPRSALGQLANVHLSVSVRDVNTAIMELLIMAYALKTSCAKNIIGVIPYFPYSKQCKMRKRGSIVCKLLASMLAKAGNGLWWLWYSYFCFHCNSQKCVHHSQSLLL